MSNSTIVAYIVVAIISLCIARKAADKGRSFFVYFLLSMLISPLITIIIVNRLEPKIPTKEEIVIVSTEEHTTQSIELPSIKFCRKCGFELLEDSDFCSYCGTKVIKE